jgi:hypothetical protein
VEAKPGKASGCLPAGCAQRGTPCCSRDARSRRGGVVLVDHPAQKLAAADLCRRRTARRRRLACGSRERERAVRALGVVMRRVRAKDALEMAPAKHQEMVEALPTSAPAAPVRSPPPAPPDPSIAAAAASRHARARPTDAAAPRSPAPTHPLPTGQPPAPTAAATAHRRETRPPARSHGTPTTAAIRVSAPTGLSHALEVPGRLLTVAERVVVERRRELCVRARGRAWHAEARGPPSSSVAVRPAEVERTPDDRATLLERTLVAEVLPQTERDGRRQQAAATGPAVGHVLVTVVGWHVCHARTPLSASS